MNIGAFLSWTIVGLVVGYIVHIWDSQETKGKILGTLIAALLGALAGGLLANGLFGIGLFDFNIATTMLAGGVAIILAAIQRTFSKGVKSASRKNKDIAYYSQITPLRNERSIRDRNKKKSSHKKTT